MSVMKRNDDWPERLKYYLEDVRDRAFAWGENDCILFAAGALEQMTGVDTAAEFRGKYKTELGAARLLKRLAPKGLPVAIAEALNTEEIAPLQAQRGDVVLIPTEDGKSALGIVDLRGTAVVSVGGSGLEYRSLSAAVKAWRV